MNRSGNVYVKNVFCGVVHRLDRPTSGAVVFSRTSKTLERLNSQFSDKNTSKIYWAIVDAKPPKQSDTLVHFLKKNEKQNKFVTNNQFSGVVFLHKLCKCPEFRH